MKVAIEARSLSATSGGIKSYTHELITHLLLQHPEADIELIYSSKKPLGSFPEATETVIPLRSEVLLPYWLSSPIAKHIRETKPSIVHYTKAALPYTKSCPTIVTIYDVIPLLLPETQSPLRRLYWPRVLKHAASRADHIMTISERSKQDIMEHYGVSAEKITVTPLAVDTNHFSPIGKKADRPYILFVGTRDQRKNVSTLIRAFARIADSIPHRLVIAGRVAHKKDDSQAVTRKFKMQDRIEFLEYVPYADLPTLYSEADLFVWPSTYEGWGLPPQEAMACGTPVIVSDGGSLPEVVGDAGSVIPFTTADLHARIHDEQFTEALSQEILRVLQDGVLQNAMREKGLLRAQKFSWDALARATWEVYERFSS